MRDKTDLDSASRLSQANNNDITAAIGDYFEGSTKVSTFISTSTVFLLRLN